MALPRTGLGTTSLGAVGGPTGTAAGALRIIVEFLTQYDSKAMRQLEEELGELTQLEDRLANDQIKIAERVAKQRTKIAETEALIRARITDRASKAELRKAAELRKVGTPAAVREAQELTRLALARQNLTNNELRQIKNLEAARTRLRNLERDQNRIQAERLGIAEQEAALQAQQASFQQLKGSVLPRLGGLALGAVGGLVGGAILGVGFSAAQAVLDSIAEKFQDILDPARHAREALEEVATAINSIRDANQGFTDDQAAAQFLRELGLAADAATIALLGKIAATQKDKEFIDQYLAVQELAKHAEVLRTEQVNRLKESLIEQAIAEGTITEQQLSGRAGLSLQSQYLAMAENQLAQAHSNATAEAERQSAAQAALQRNLQATALLAQYAADALNETINAGAQTAFINPIQSQIEGLQDAGPSARTQALEAQIEKLQAAGSGGGGAAKSRELANIAEERALILLRMRLRDLGTAINLEEYEGKFLLEAIKMKVQALEKQQAAQERLNRLLDLQFRMSKQLRRQEGESINDFLERRAQENRNMLNEQRQLEFEAVRESLQEQQEKVADEVALAELSQRQQTAAANTGTSNRIKALQKELEASRKADRDALDAKIKALQKQKEAYEKAAANAAYYATIAANEEIREAARAANSVAKIAALSGKSRGLTAAKEFLTALLQSGVLSPSEASDVLAAINRINKSLSAIGEAQYNVAKNTIVKPGTAPIPFAEGGILPLISSSAYGKNARFGEKGTEGAALVLTNQAMQKMNKGRNAPAVGQITLESRDPLRDRYMLRREIKQVVREELNA